MFSPPLKGFSAWNQGDFVHHSGARAPKISAKIFGKIGILLRMRYDGARSAGASAAF
jgi:hypothetical protein